jgi:cytochrome b involved in lipid metabolism
MCFKSKKPLFSLQEILQHRTKESFWILWKNKVYDITDFYFKHPGGSCIFIHLDATPHMIYHSKYAKDLLKSKLIGYLQINKVN